MMCVDACAHMCAHVSDSDFMFPSSVKDNFAKYSRLESDLLICFVLILLAVL